MKKSLTRLVTALLVLALLGAAGAVSENLQKDPMSVPTGSNGLPEGYDPAAEEDYDSSIYTFGGEYDEYGRSKYAGATPIPLDPIDMPTPTPKPTIPFSYGIVSADKIGVTFEAPVGWQIDTSADDSVTLRDPNPVDGVNATLMVRIASVASGYKLSDVKSDLHMMLKELGQYNYSSWTTTDTATRTLLKKDGYYADYYGDYYDGTSVYGRVMMALLDGNRVITVHLSCPNGYFSSSYKSVINHVRETLKQQ
ncbi:MAG: hypothetical protein IKQ41_01115 [Clostridia bacterium]|nr:hypothetical protein [Clostridia bacterium]